LTKIVKWFKDNTELSESDRVKFFWEPQNNTHSLIIPAALSTDDGQYHVLASNSNGEVIAAFSVIVSADA
jgi:hypothetical protein